MLILIVLAFFALPVTIVITGTVSAGLDNRETYACTRPPVRCDVQTNAFNSIITVGHVQPIGTVNGSKIDPIEGVFGNSMAINGYRQQYFTIPNKQVINPEVFSVSFWIKQDPSYIGNSAIISHTNIENTAGWSFQFNVTKSQKSIQFSVRNTDGKTFTVSTPFDTGIFQNLVGTFDGKELKIYLNGFLIDSTQFQGKYESDPGMPLNVGLNSYNFGRSWTGQIDELRIYNKSILPNYVGKLSDYGSYIELSRSNLEERGLVGYWPFDGVTTDKSPNHNNGVIVLPSVSMAFSPDGRLFYSVRDTGEIRIISQFGHQLKTPFVRPFDTLHQDILGIVIDPNFVSNHYVFAYRTATDNKTGDIFNQVIRFTESGNKATDEKILVDKIPVGKRQGGALAFGPDDRALYHNRFY